MQNPEDAITKMVIDISSAEITLLSKGVIIISKNLLAMFVALAKEAKRTKGKIGISNLENKTSRITTIQIPPEKLHEFKGKAKQFNVLYSLIKPKTIDLMRGKANKGDMIDVVVGEKDAAKLERIAEKMNLKDNVMNSLTHTGFSQKNDDNTMIEIQRKDKEGHNYVFKVPLNELSRDDLEGKLESVMSNTQFINEKDVASEIGQADIAGTLNNFFSKEEKINQKMKELYPDFSPREEEKWVDTKLTLDSFYQKEKREEPNEPVLEKTLNKSDVVWMPDEIIINSPDYKRELAEFNELYANGTINEQQFNEFQQNIYYRFKEGLEENPETDQMVKEVRKIVETNKAKQELTVHLEPDNPIRKAIETEEKNIEKSVMGRLKEMEGNSDANKKKQNSFNQTKREQVMSVMDKLEEEKKKQSLGKLQGESPKIVFKNKDKEIVG